MDTSKLKKENDNVTFILVIVDIFSKFCRAELTAICGGTMPRTLHELKGKLRSSIVVLLCPHIETALSAQDEEDLWRVLTSNQQKG